MINSDAVKRREFLKGFGVASAIVAVEDNNQNSNVRVDDQSVRLKVHTSLTLNGKKKSFDVDSRTTLIDLLRENEHMTGTKKGCDHGACGACTVLVNGKRILSCLTLAATIDGEQVETIEGITDGESLHPLQNAFLRCDAYQCGYCTPGQIMSGIACIEEGHAAKSTEEAREWMSGNLCRCSAYPNILAAVRQTAGAEPIGDPAIRTSPVTKEAVS
jgi:xanthine dehydrogenase YagT iron-sulfur-binding subunit